MDSPYLSLISLVKGWPKQNVRREVLMVTDGIDRLRGESPQLSPMGPSSRMGANPGMGMNSRLGPDFGPGVYHSMPQISADATSASEISQRYNVIVYSIYGVGVGRMGRSSWDAELGISGLDQDCGRDRRRVLLAEHDAVGELQALPGSTANQLANQYFLAFDAVPKGKKGSLQRVKLEAEIPNSELLAPDNVWVEAPAAGTGK